MRVRILVTFYWAAEGRRVFSGEVIDVDDEFGQGLIDDGCAEKGREASGPPKDK